MPKLPPEQRGVEIKDSNVVEARILLAKSLQEGTIQKEVAEKLMRLLDDPEAKDEQKLPPFFTF